jgi:glutamyl-tRNA synthetase
MPSPPPECYRGRIAPSPTGLLHLGHASTFWTAHQRCREFGGTLIVRMDDLDGDRCKKEFATAALEDLHWLGITWEEGPDSGGPCGPYAQSERLPLYKEAFEKLRTLGSVYPCTCSRKDVARALSAPHAPDDEPFYPGTCRPAQASISQTPRAGTNWRFRIDPPQNVGFKDLAMGEQNAFASRHFGDFLIWRKDDYPSYQLASAVDDALMGVTEIVRGEDLIPSTFRQILIWRCLGYPLPRFFHCNLLRDENGKRLAKRDNARSLQTLRENGCSPGQIHLLIEEARKNVNRICHPELGSTPA